MTSKVYYETENYKIVTGESLYGEKQVDVYQIVSKMSGMVEHETTVYPNARRVLSQMEDEMVAITVQDAEKEPPKVYTH